MLQNYFSLDKKKKKGNWKISMKEMKRITRGFDWEKAQGNDKCRLVAGGVDFKPCKAQFCQEQLFGSFLNMALSIHAHFHGFNGDLKLLNPFSI